MLKKYRVRLLDEILSGGYSWNDFEIYDVDLDVLQINIRYEKKFLFRAQESSETFHSFSMVYTRFEKNYPLIKEKNYIPFDELAGRFRQWLTEVDLWMYEYGDTIRRKNAERNVPVIFSRIDFAEDELFSEEEKIILRKDIDAASKYVKTEVDLPKDKQDAIRNALVTLAADLEKAAKPEWKSSARSLMRDVVVNAATDTATLHILLSTFGYIVGTPAQIFTDTTIRSIF